MKKEKLKKKDKILLKILDIERDIGMCYSYMNFSNQKEVSILIKKLKLKRDLLKNKVGICS